MQNLELKDIFCCSWHKIAWKPASLLKINGGSILTHLYTDSRGVWALFLIWETENLIQSLHVISLLSRRNN